VGQPRHGYWCVLISSIHLLRTFIEAGNTGLAGARYTETAVGWQTVIHLTFILSAIAIAFVPVWDSALAGRHSVSHHPKSGL
jgi:uncharacterized protein (TIGR00645 family)